MLHFPAIALKSAYTGLLAERLEIRAQAWRSAAAAPGRTALGRDSDLLMAAVTGAAARAQKFAPIAWADRALMLADASSQAQLRRPHTTLGAIGVALGATLAFVPKALGAFVGALCGAAVGVGHVLLVHLGLVCMPADATPSAALELVAPASAFVLEPRMPGAFSSDATPSPPSASTSRDTSARSSRANSIDTPPTEGLAFSFEHLSNPALVAALSPKEKLAEPGFVPNAWHAADMSPFGGDVALSKQFLLDVVRLNGPLVFLARERQINVDRLMPIIAPETLSFPERCEQANKKVAPLLVELCDSKPHWAYAVGELTHQGFWGELITKIDDSWTIEGKRMRMPLMHAHLSEMSLHIEGPSVRGEHANLVKITGELIWKPRIGREYGLDTLEVAEGRRNAKPEFYELHPNIQQPAALRATATLLVPEPRYIDKRRAFEPVVPQQRIEIRPLT